MSQGSSSLTRTAIFLFGLIISISGLAIAYFAQTSVIEFFNPISPNMFTPIGVLVFLIGGFMMITRTE